MSSQLRVAQHLLAAFVLLIAISTFLGLPRPYPSWPTLGPLPINPELLVPGALGFVALLEPIHQGLNVGSVTIATVGAVTLWLAATSVYTLSASSTGGVFWGGFLTLLSGAVLAGLILVQRVVYRRRQGAA
ncbi:hypothetical protein [Natronorubrum bangense]|nr:hypothetical protein [Natronorubrum bangense]QCC53454.1 hypothetical protein DV706_02515 [Natronorubrum bangense]